MDNSNQPKRNGGTYEDLIGSFTTNDFKMVLAQNVHQNDYDFLQICKAYGALNIVSVFMASYIQFRTVEQACQFTADMHLQPCQGLTIQAEGRHLDGQFDDFVNGLIHGLRGQGMSTTYHFRQI